ncbi:MAG: MBL fold metallo-hydrolase, partial [Magnetococcales bacterium]|nr:MBL fold metallo-hydrolase [Magnetococcales bacterium]
MKGRGMILTGSIILFLALLLSGCAALLRSSQFGATTPNLVSTHDLSQVRYRDERFFNTHQRVKKHPSGSMWTATREWFFPSIRREPTQPPPVNKLDTLRVGDGQTHVTWMGHSSLLIEVDGQTILIDPNFSRHASPFSWLPPKSFFPEMPVTPEQIDHLHAVVISHDHYDHLDHDTIIQLAGRVDRFIVPLGVGAHLRHWGIDPTKITELAWWASTDLNGVTLTATPAHHFSGRRLTGGNRTLWAGWAIAGRSERLFFSGDSGYFPGFKEIGKRLGPFDLTMLECGAYNDAWADIHMMPEETAQAHLDLGGKTLLPIHWARFDLALHHWTEPVQRLLT